MERVLSWPLGNEKSQKTRVRKRGVSLGRGVIGGVKEAWYYIVASSLWHAGRNYVFDVAVPYVFSQPWKVCLPGFAPAETKSVRA